MDSKKVIDKLIKIAEKQQKIIVKLAQQLPQQSLPASPHAKDPVTFIQADPGYAAIANLVGMMTPRGPQNLDVTFKPGATQDTVTALTKILSKMPGPAWTITPVTAQHL